MISQIILAAGTDLALLVAASGPFSLARWNDILEEIGGNRRKSFELASAEIESSLDPVYDDLDGDDSISDVRGDEASLRSLVERLGCPRPVLERLLAKTHGGTALASFVKRYQAEAIKAPAKSARQGVIAFRIASTSVSAKSVEVLNQDWLKQFLQGADSVSIAAGYYDVNFIDLQLQKNPHLKNIRLLFNGLGGQRLEAQFNELTLLHRTLSTRFKLVEIRLAFAPGIFHTKLFLAANGPRARALVGSANATIAAFSKQRNEELLVALPEAGALVGYFEKAWSAARQLSQLDAAAKSLVAFFRTGILYFKPTSTLTTTINPFRELISKLSPTDQALLGGIALPHADPESAIGAFNLKRAVGNQSLLSEVESDEDDEIARVINASIKPLSIETCYGYWVPSALDGMLQERLSKAGSQKEARLLQFSAALNDVSDTDLVKKYEEYLEAVGQALKKLPNGPPVLTRDPYDTEPFSKFVAGVKRQLEDDERRKRLTHPFVPGKIPEIWDDALAYEDFLKSFFEYLAHIAQRGSKRPNVPGKILKKIASDDSADTTTLRQGFEKILKVNGWRSEDWGVP